jgi:hypothetical protein
MPDFFGNLDEFGLTGKRRGGYIAACTGANTPHVD